MNDLINYEKYALSSVGKSSTTAFEVVDEIKKLEIITPEEISQLKNAQAFALSNFRDVPSYRPMIVKLTSVLNDASFPTIDKKFWQCKIEAEVHFNELVRDYFKYEKSLVDLEEMSYKIQEIDSMLNKDVEPNAKLDPNLLNFDKKRLIIKKSQYEYELKLLEKDIKYRIQEVVDWAFISREIESKCEYSTSSYQEHTVKGHILFIQNKLKTSKLDAIEQKNLQAQLDTFKRLNKST
jgi:hypothetical protein